MNHHLVQFYEDDVFLIKGLADYIGQAISTGNKGIAIATSDHLSMLESTLSARGSRTSQAIPTTKTLRASSHRMHQATARTEIAHAREAQRLTTSRRGCGVGKRGKQ